MRKKFVCPLVGIKSRALDVLGKHSTTELYAPRLQAFTSFEKNLHTHLQIKMDSDGSSRSTPPLSK